MLLNKELPKEEIKMTSANIFLKRATFLANRDPTPARRVIIKNTRDNIRRHRCWRRGYPFTPLIGV